MTQTLHSACGSSGQCTAESDGASCATALFAPGTDLRASNEYMVGTTNTANKVPKLMPPTITQPICVRLSAPAPVAKASGTKAEAAPHK